MKEDHKGSEVEIEVEVFLTTERINQLKEILFQKWLNTTAKKIILREVKKNKHV